MSVKDLEAELQNSIVTVSAKKGRKCITYKIVSEEFFQKWVSFYNTHKEDESFILFTSKNSLRIFGFDPERNKYFFEMFGNLLKPK